MSEPEKPVGTDQESTFDAGTSFGPAKNDPIKPGQIAGGEKSFVPRRSLMTAELAQLEETLMSGEVSAVERNKTEERIRALRLALGLEQSSTAYSFTGPELAARSGEGKIRDDALVIEFKEKFQGNALESLADEYEKLLKENGAAGGVLVTENNLIDYAKAKGLIGQSNITKNAGTKAARILPAAPDPFTAGNKLRMNLVAGKEEVAIKADKYAEVLKDFFIATKDDGEVCFALYGHWGRGKSFLMRLVAENLQREKYVPVHFSAWKYPNAPEVWVHLYETLADKAYDTNFFLKYPRIIRAGIAKKGPWPLLWALALLAIALVPKFYALEKGWQWLLGLSALVGLGGMIWLADFFHGVTKTKKRLTKDFLTTTRHTEKLGLQATIGKDLKALLQGWIPQGGPSFGAIIAICCYVGVILLIEWCTWHWFGFALPEGIARHPFEFLQSLTKLHPELQRWLTMSVPLVGGILFAWVFLRFFHPQRILLIVDDLDRCAPAQLLSVMESIKLLLDDEEINKRVQVAMLIEENVLNYALKQKYGQLGMEENRMLQENKEKLFNVQLRMGQLSDEDVSDLLEGIVAKQRMKANVTHKKRLSELNQESEKFKNKLSSLGANELKEVLKSALDGLKKTLQDAKAGRPIHKTRNDERDQLLNQINEGRWRKAAPSRSTPLGYKLSDSEFDVREENAFQACLPQLRQGKQAKNFGPRSIRAFVFRYQLARLIVIKLEIPWTPEELVSELARAATGDNLGVVKGISEELKAVVRQVSNVQDTP